MQKWKIDELLKLMTEAGETALRESSALVPELKSDQSIVTSADREIEARYAAEFDRPDAGTFMIGEETIDEKSEEYIRAALRGRCYVVDPIDGTAPYAFGLPIWGTSIGLMENGVLTEGAIYRPALDEAFFTCGGTAWQASGLRSGAPDVRPYEMRRAPLSAGSPISVPQIGVKTWKMSFPNQAFSWSCCVGSYAGVLEGKLLAYIHSSRLWDLAGGLPVLRAAGFALRYRDGGEFDPRVTESGEFDFGPEAGKRRWHHKRYFVVTPDVEAAEFVWQHISIPENNGIL